MHDTPQTIFSYAKKFFSGTLLSRILGLLRDISMASAFGVHPSVAAFMLAFRLSHFGRRLFGEGAMASAFTPYFEEKRKTCEREAHTFFWSLFLTMTLFLTLCGSIAAFFLSYGDESAQLTALMLPSLVFICLYGVTNAYLQCDGIYFTGAAAPALFNVVWIVGVYFLRDLPEADAMWWLALVVNLACLTQFLTVLPPALKKLEFHFDPKVVLPFLPPFFTIVGGVAATQINNAIDPLFAITADPEGPALLWYAIRIQQLPLALIGIAMSSALLPSLSRTQNQALLTSTLKKTTLLILPIVILYLFFGKELIALLFQRGDFDSAATIATNSCLIGYSLALLPATLVLVLAPSFYAENRNSIPLKGSVLSVILNILLNAFFIYTLHSGAESVAYATAIATWANLLYLFYYKFKKSSLLIN